MLVLRPKKKETSDGVRHRHDVPVGSIRRDIPHDRPGQRIEAVVAEAEAAERCLMCSKPLIMEAPSIRIQYGTMKYGELGDAFEPEYFHDGSTAKYMHHECADEAGVKPDEYERGWCRICNRQFCYEPQRGEGALHVERGNMLETNKAPFARFKGITGGNIHWACAWDEWSPGAFRRLIER